MENQIKNQKAMSKIVKGVPVHKEQCTGVHAGSFFDYVAPLGLQDVIDDIFAKLISADDGDYIAQAQIAATLKPNGW